MLDIARCTTTIGIRRCQHIQDLVVHVGVERHERSAGFSGAPLCSWEPGNGLVCTRAIGRSPPCAQFGRTKSPPFFLPDSAESVRTSGLPHLRGGEAAPWTDCVRAAIQLRYTAMRV